MALVLCELPATETKTIGFLAMVEEQFVLRGHSPQSRILSEDALGRTLRVPTHLSCKYCSMVVFINWETGRAVVTAASRTGRCPKPLPQTHLFGRAGMIG